MAINSLIWIVVIVLAILLVIKFKQRFFHILSIVAGIVIVTQIMTLAIVGIVGQHTDDDKGASGYLSKYGEFTVSSGNNTIVLLLDCFDAQLLVDLHEAETEYVDSVFEDSTFYHNTTGGATRTKYAIPYIFSGMTNAEEISYQEYISKAYAQSEFIDGLRAKDYDVGIYTEKTFVDLTQKKAIDNIVDGEATASSQVGLTTDYMRLIAFRYAPSFYTRYFWMYSSDFDRWKKDEESGEYAVDDVHFYNELKDRVLKIDTDQSCFRFYHLKGAHEPYTMNEMCEEVLYTQCTEHQQGMGCIRIIDAYINQLKKLGIYDNATIVVMADHGYRGYYILESNPVFLVKNPLERHALDVSELPLSYKSLPRFFLDAVRGEPHAMEQYAVEGDRYYYIGLEEGSEIDIIEYIIHGKAWDTDNIEQSGVVYHGNSLKRARTYRLGNAISFGEDDSRYNYRNYVVDGFSFNEKTFVWTEGNKTEMYFDIDGEYQNIAVTFDICMTLNGRQRMNVFANDHLVARTALDGECKYKFIIPKEYIENGKLDLALQLPDAASPRINGDNDRDIALAFRSILLESTDEDFDRQNAENYIPGSVVLFDKERTNLDMYEHSGFSEAEEGFTWTDGNAAKIVFNMQDVGVDLDLMLHYSTFQDKQTVKVYGNGTLLEEYVAEGEEVKRIVIPRQILSNDKLEIILELPDACSPTSIGVNSDGRILALAMKSIEIDYADDQPDQEKTA